METRHQQIQHCTCNCHFQYEPSGFFNDHDDFTQRLVAGIALLLACAIHMPGITTPRVSVVGLSRVTRDISRAPRFLTKLIFLFHGAWPLGLSGCRRSKGNSCEKHRCQQTLPYAVINDGRFRPDITVLLARVNHDAWHRDTSVEGDIARGDSSPADPASRKPLPSSTPSAFALTCLSFHSVSTLMLGIVCLSRVKKNLVLAASLPADPALHVPATVSNDGRCHIALSLRLAH